MARRHLAAGALLLALAALAGLADEAAAATRRAPVRHAPLQATVEHALRLAHVPARTRRADLRLVRSAERLVRSHRAGSRDVAGMLASLALLASAPLPPERAAAAFAELRVTLAAIRQGGLPAVGTRLQIDDVTFQRYAENGLRYQPLATYWLARDTARSGNAAATRTRLDAALRFAVATPTGLDAEYLFGWAGGRPPWTSPMAGALAMDAFARGWRLTGDARYLDAAVRSFRAVEAAAVRTGTSVWFPIYPFAPGLRVLNADLQVVLGLEAIRDVPGAEAAGPLADDAAATAAAALPAYDTGAWSRYSTSAEARLEYHDLMTAQLFELDTITGNEAFGDLGTRFVAYRLIAPVVTPVGSRRRTLYPVPADRFRDVARLAFTLDKWSTVMAVARNGRGAVVWRAALGRLHRGTHTVSWAPGTVAEGAYTVSLRAVDLAGNVTEAPLALIAIRRDTEPPAVLSAIRSGNVVRWSVRDEGSGSITVILARGSRSQTIAHAALAGSAKVKFAPTTATFVDASGNRTTVDLIVGPQGGYVHVHGAFGALGR